MKRLNLVLCLVCTLLTSSAAQAATLRTVALIGQQAPGKPDGTVFRSFSSNRPIVLNNAGQTAFRAFTSDSNLGGIWSEGAGSLNLVAEPDQQAPGMPDGVTYGNFTDPVRIVIGDAGVTAFNGYFSSSSSFGMGFWSSGPGGSALIAREGEQAAGTPAGVAYAFFNERSLVIGDAGQTAFQAYLTGSGVDSSNSEGIWAQRYGNLALVARTGNHAPGTPSGTTFSGTDGLALNKFGQTAFFAFLTGSGVDTTNNWGIWSEGSGSLALVARSGNQAPGTPSGVNFSYISTPSLNIAGQTAYWATLVGAGVDATNNQGIWSEASGSLALVARSGSPAPGTPSGVNFDRVSQFVSPPPLNDAGEIAFFATLAGAGVDPTNRLGLWSGAPGSLALVARTGDRAPGTEDGVVFADFTHTFGGQPESRTLILNAAGQTAFVGQLTGSGISASNDLGIWATDRSGALQLIVREGDLLEVAPGDFRSFRLGTFLGDSRSYSTGNGDGRPSAFNNRGQLAFSGGFTGGPSGIFVSNRVAVPEPSTFILAAAAFAGLLLPRRAVGSRERRTQIIADHPFGLAEISVD